MSALCDTLGKKGYLSHPISIQPYTTHAVNSACVQVVGPKSSVLWPPPQLDCDHWEPQGAGICLLPEQVVHSSEQAMLSGQLFCDQPSCGQCPLWTLYDGVLHHCSVSSAPPQGHPELRLRSRLRQTLRLSSGPSPFPGMLSTCRVSDLVVRNLINCGAKETDHPTRGL